MFKGVYEKLERAGYFLNNLKKFAEDAGGFPYIKERQEMRANLDGFFFEMISAKDFFLQGINDKYGSLLPRNKCTTNLGQLIGLLGNDNNAAKAVTRIRSLLSRENSWLWRINNYRNSATHRELLHLGHKAVIDVDKMPLSEEKINMIKQGKVRVRPIFSGQEIPSGVPRVQVPAENVKTYLFKDPEDPQQGNADKEVIPYCEQCLRQIREFLDDLFGSL